MYTTGGGWGGGGQWRLRGELSVIYFPNQEGRGRVMQFFSFGQDERHQFLMRWEISKILLI